ncbi:MAG: hypothetical protein QM758_04885 [Armatimonas sp.]
MTQSGNEAALLPTRSLRWKAAAQSVGGRYEPGDFWSPERITLACSPWILTLHSEHIQTPLTIVSAATLSRTPLRLTLLGGEFQRDWHGIDLADLEIGDMAFDAPFQITTSSPALAKALFTRPGFRTKLLALPHLAIDLRRGNLRIATVGIVDNPESLITLLAIGVEILQTQSFPNIS